MNETVMWVITIILGIVMLFLTGFLIRFSRKKTRDDRYIKVLEENIRQLKANNFTDTEREKIISGIREDVSNAVKEAFIHKEALSNNTRLLLNSGEVEALVSSTSGLLNKDLVKQAMRLARLNNEIAFKEDRTTELDKAIVMLNDEIINIQKTIDDNRALKVKIAAEIEQHKDSLVDMLTRAQAEKDQLAMEVQALSEEKLRLQKDIEKSKKEHLVLGEDLSGVRKRIEELIAIEKNMRLHSARENLGHGMALEFDEIELVEIKELREVLVRLRNATPLEKAIYEIYYRDKMKRMVGVLGLDGVSGVYRIWTTEGGVERNYVGQSVNVGDRWIQHLKRMVGAEEPTGIVLYAAAKKIGVENLKWECIEKCDKKDLSEREKYWGNFYAVKETGWNTKLG